MARSGKGKDRYVTAALLEGEKERFTQLATRRGMSVSEYIRQLILIELKTSGGEYDI